ncbi:hypothetical protein JIX55_42825 [Streptomyces sp. DSM 40750]|nr:hypothetical protein JIX55_42825 [Streptomyces sp. DSM 40750]
MNAEAGATPDAAPQPRAPALNEAPSTGHSNKLDHERGRGRDHHRTQHMSPSGAEAAEEVGASMGE